MKLLIKSFDDPYENIAFEEQLFKTFDAETLRLWINPTSVVCGKHQIALKECDALYCSNNQIPIIRRISGGGTVFHDSGNINFSFFKHVDSKNPVNYKDNLRIMQRLLDSLGMKVTISERNDLFHSDFKVSGNAQHVSKGRALHHGTLLYDSKLTELIPAIKRKSGKFIDKSVASVPSQVMNLRSINDVGTTEEFLNRIKTRLSEEFDLDNSTYRVRQDLFAKYKSDVWNFHYGPKYQFENQINGASFLLKVARGGRIIDAYSEDAELNDKISGLIDAVHSPSGIDLAINGNLKLDKSLRKSLL